MFRLRSILKPSIWRVVLCCLFSSTGICVQAQQLFQITRLRGDPEFDGNLEEDVWNEVVATPLVMLNPNAGGPPTENTVFKMGYTDEFLYVALFNYDSDPSGIQSSSKKRDEMELNNDWCGISLDSYNDHENALCFCTTPISLRLDMQIMNDGEGDFPVNPDWNAFWDVETEITPEGWFAEFRIPLSTLRYQVTDGKVVMGLSVFRYIARHSEWDIYPAISNKWGFWSWAKVSQFQQAELRNIKSVNQFYLSPYVLGGYQHSVALKEDGSAYSGTTSWKHTAGMDVKYGLAKNMTLDLTVNTDFAQVEADDQEINLTRYSLFFPEKRQFFMERANVFDFTFGDEGRLFYSRTIGLYESRQVPIWGGGRLTGRAGKWDLGLLSLQTGFLEGDTGRIIETANHSVIRTRRQVALNKNSYVGFMGTSTLGRFGEYNLGYGLDAILNLKGDTYLKLAWAQTADSDSSNNLTSLDPSRYQLFLEKRSFEGFSYQLDYERAGISYHPEMGFEFRSDFTKMAHHTGYGIIPEAGSKIARMSFDINGTYYFRNADKSLETLELTPSYTLTTKQSAELFVELAGQYDDVRSNFDLSDEVTVEADVYKNLGIDASYTTPTERLFYTRFSVYSGWFYGGWRNSASVSPLISFGNTWRFSLEYYFYRIDFAHPQQVYLSQLMRFRTWYMYSTKLSAQAFLQYNSLNGGIYINTRIRYNPREGNDLYIVYNDALNVNRYDYDPVLPLSQQRAVLIKYTHTFRIR